MRRLGGAENSRTAIVSLRLPTTTSVVQSKAQLTQVSLKKNLVIKMSWDTDLSKMMHLCFCIIHSETGKTIAPEQEWKNDAKVLGVKIFRHIASAQQAGIGVSFQYDNQQLFSHIDHSSIAVLVRAAIETYLAFSFIFTNEDKDENLSIYRHKLWQRSGLLDRGKMLANTPESKEILRRESDDADALLGEITSSQFYLESNRKAREQIDSGNWKPKGGWHGIANQTNIHQKYFSDIYNHLSGHAHASFISALQIRDAREIKDQKMLAEATLKILCKLISHFLFSYVKVFPAAKIILESDADLFKIASRWHIQKEEVTSIYG